MRGWKLSRRFRRVVFEEKSVEMALSFNLGGLDEERNIRPAQMAAEGKRLKTRRALSRCNEQPTVLIEEGGQCPVLG